MSFPSDFESNDWEQATRPTAKPHPHPLRTNIVEKDLPTVKTIDTTSRSITSDRPDSTILSHPYIERHSFNSTRSDRPSLTILSPLEAHPPLRSPPTERFSNVALSPIHSNFPVIPSRPPLRPTVSFGSETRVSYYSISTLGTNDLDKKTQTTVVTQDVEQQPYEDPVAPQRDWKFVACFAILCLLRIICGMSATSLATAMPTIARTLDMNAVTSFWIANSFLLASALTQPLIMRLSYAFGGRILLTLAIGICTLGSLICAVASGPMALLAGRCLAGCGSGALGVLTQLILHKLATPQNRSKWESTISALYWLGAALGPILGGAAAAQASYNFIFWVNVPFGALALVILPFIVSLDDSSSWRELASVDYLGWLLLSGSVAPILLAISFGGSAYNWTSWHTLTPLVAGSCSLALFVIYARYRVEPILPITILRRATACISCTGTLVHGLLFAAVVFMLPLWFEPIHKLDPIISGALLSACTLAMVLFAVVTSVMLCYVSHVWLVTAGWALVVASMALVSVTTTQTAVVIFVPLGLLAGAGFGILYPALTVAIQSDATTDDETIHAVPLQGFFSTIGQCFGIAIGSCLFLNQLKHSLQGSSLTIDHAEEYARDAVSLANAMAQMSGSHNGLQSSLATSYAFGLKWVWASLCIISGVALLLSLILLRQYRRPSQRRTSRRSIPEAFELAA